MASTNIHIAYKHTALGDTMTRLKIRSLAAGVTLALLSAGGPALAQNSDSAALESRVAELEAMLKKVVEKKAAAPAAAPSSSGTTYKFGGYAKFDAM